MNTLFHIFIYSQCLIDYDGSISLYRTNPKRIDALIIDIYMNVTKEFWVIRWDIHAKYLILKDGIDANYETKSLDIRMTLNYYWRKRSIVFLSC